jgi:8-oxo-dGTP pyrophosphatase MutT (NUDIX family)
VPSHSLDILASLPVSVPAATAAMAEAQDPQAPVVVPRPAASVVLCRDGAAGLETFLLHRHARMVFAASVAVFPGGGVDPVDRDRGDGSDDAVGDASALLACAVRETREETGVELAPAELRPWAHWITPVGQPVRYDTHFFVAGLPAGQSARDLSSETEHAEWLAPRAAVDAYQEGTVALMPPTLSILLELAPLPSVAAVLERARARVIETVLPDVVRDPAGSSASGWVYRYPRRGEQR